MEKLPSLTITPFYSLIFFLYHITTVNSSRHPYIPVDNITLDCGSSADIIAEDGREWMKDEHSKFAQTPEQSNSSTISNYASTSIPVPNSGTKVPFSTARIFRSPFTYSFPVTPGPKFVRLYFYPAQYQDFDASKAYFHVKAGSFTLLKNFSANLVAKNLNQDSFMREFCINVAEPDQRLNLTFVPSSSDNYSYAFVNGIEIVSMPTDLYYGVEKGMHPPSFVAQNNQPFEISDNLALETIWRINMGGRSISAKDDTGMYRKWSEEGNSILVTDNHLPFNPTDVTKPLEYTKISNYTAPDEVYQTALSMGNNSTYNSLHNFTCRLPVDRGFNYLVRLHFCEFQEEITKASDRTFDIYIGSQVAQSNFDVIVFSGGNGIPIYQDYVICIHNEDYLSIDLHPSKERSRNLNTILNGVELLKISNNGNLAGPNPELDQTPPF